MLLNRKNVTVMDSLEIIAACDLETGLYTLLNEYMKVYEVPLTFAKHYIHILGQDIR